MRTLLLGVLISMAAVTAPPPIEHETADVNGVRLHYAKSGTGQFILFLHGFPEFWYAWKNQLESSARDHLAVAPDMRGYNLSSKPPQVDQYRIPLLVEDVQALAESLGFGPNAQVHAGRTRLGRRRRLVLRGGASRHARQAGHRQCAASRRFSAGCARIRHNRRPAPTC